ncbi:penicillin-binding transpeptidase domain-containing protein [soil metagenome]
MTLLLKAMRRSFVLLAGAVVVAGGAAVVGAPAAEIKGAPLGGGQPATEVAAFANLADTTIVPDGSRRAVAHGTPLGALIDLDHIERVGDHYEAPLKDGRRAVLTLDPDLQPLAEKLLDQARAPRGAIVVMAPDGRILALAGRRTEEPKGAIKGTFDWRLATDAWAPAASVFKLVTATALVGAGVTGDEKVCFHGGLRSVTESNLRDDKRDSRCETLGYGVAHSNNAILGKLAFQKLQPAGLESAARSLGLFDALPGAQLPGNAGKLTLPTLHDLEFAKTAAGFLNVQLSVAGGALLAATFADRGEQPVPRMIASIDGQTLAVPAAKRVMSADNAAEVARMMVGTCDSGSASKSFGRRGDLKVAGKTGTLTRTEPFYMEHSWFVGFAPADKPQVIVSVLFGNSENWHLKGHEAGRRLIDRALRSDAISRAKDRTAGM